MPPPPGAPACLLHSRSQLAQHTTSRPSPELSTRNCSSRSTGGSPLGPFTTVWCLRRSCSQDPDAPSPGLPVRSRPPHSRLGLNTERVGDGVLSPLASAINISASAHSDPCPSPCPLLGESWEVLGLATWGDKAEACPQAPLIALGTITAMSPSPTPAPDLILHHLLMLT